MTPEQESHLAGIKARTCAGLDEKYRRGQHEHGGNLWLKPGMLTMLKAETRDFIVYADTLEQQLREVLTLLRAGKCEDAGAKLDALLNGPDE